MEIRLHFPAISLPAYVAGKIFPCQPHRERAHKYLITWIYLRCISTILSPNPIFSRVFPAWQGKHRPAPVREIMPDEASVRVASWPGISVPASWHGGAAGGAEARSALPARRCRRAPPAPV